jgi:hypothetical protein
MNNAEGETSVESEGVAVLYNFIKSVRAIVECKSEGTEVNPEKLESATQQCKERRAELSTTLTVRLSSGNKSIKTSSGKARAYPAIKSFMCRKNAIRRVAVCAVTSLQNTDESVDPNYTPSR